jgi:hypothetical protein
LGADEGLIEQHCMEIERCNQRGGRMLSLVDLLAAGTVDAELAGYLCAAVNAGHSFLVGCVPGGGGKTTVMGALLNVTPADLLLEAADGGAAIEEARRNPTPRRGMICHEIGAGGYYAYLWGAEARAFFALTRVGHVVATNLHTDTLSQCRAQLCDENGVAPEDFARVGVKLFLHVGSGWGRRTRRVAAVHEAEPGGEHRELFRWLETEDRFERLGESRLVTPAQEAACRAFLTRLAERKACTIEEVRRAVAEELKNA